MAARPTSLGLTPQLALLLPPHCRQRVGLLKLLGAHLSLALIPQLVLPMRVVTSRSVGTPRTRHELVAQPCLVEVFPSWRLRGARLCSLWPRRADRGRRRPWGRPWHCWGWPSSCTVVIAVVWLATQRHVVQANLQQFMVDRAAGRTPLLATLLLDIHRRANQMEHCSWPSVLCTCTCARKLSAQWTVLRADLLADLASEPRSSCHQQSCHLQSCWVCRYPAFMGQQEGQSSRPR